VRNWKRKRDNNDAELAAIAREEGAELMFIGEPVDYLCVIGDLWIPAEIKNPEGRAYGVKKFTKQQEEMMAVAQEHGALFFVWETAEDVRRDVRAVLARFKPAAAA
jgi:hypothetical protein